MSLKHARFWCRQVESEVDRMILNPAKGVAYMIGQRHIRGLLEKAQAALEDQFDWRDFHHVILREGALPLSLLSEQVELWLSKHKTPVLGGT